jgi:alpha-glucosidase
MKLGALVQRLRLFGLRDSLRTLRFTIQRDRLDRRYRRAQRKVRMEPQSPGSLKWTRAIAHGIEIHFENAILELLFLAPDVLRITWRPGDLPIPYAIAGNEWPGDITQYEQGQGGLTLRGTQLRVELQSEGACAILNAAGTPLRTEEPPTRQGEVWQQEAPLDPRACIFGLGERACGWNLRGRTYLLWNQDPGGSYGLGHDPLYMSVPVYTCMQPQGSYMLFYENPHRGELSFNEKAQVRFERGALRTYFFAGSPAHCLNRYTLLTGRPAMPPRWAMGYHQSRWGYRSEEEIREVAADFKRHELPISAIHLDIDYMDGYRIFTFDKKRFGHVLEMANDLRIDGIRLVTILDPGVKVDRSYSVFQDGLRKGMFCTLPNGRPMLSIVWPGWVHFPDFTDPDVRHWWGSYYPRLLDQGIVGIWHDMNEPTTFTPWGDKTFPLLTRHTLEKQEGDHLGAHNLYALLMNRAGFEALKKHRPGKRPWLLSRAGYSGGQHYAWNWTGDVETSWEALHQTVATMLGLGLSGFAFTGSDIGGFSGTPDPELYLRWFQLGTFSPFFRTHSALGTPPREPWRFDEDTLHATRKLLQMRYQLMPYLYTLAWRAHQTGAPLLRPILWMDPDDAALWEISDQFFLGPDLLLAPVLIEGQRERAVHFPTGTWYDLWDDSLYVGPAIRTVPADLDRIPAFIRGGSILPLEPRETDLELHLYLPAQGSLEGILYSDEGDGYGSHRLDQFRGKRQGNTLEVNREYEGKFPWPYTTLGLIPHGAALGSMRVDGSSFDPQDQSTQIPLFEHLQVELT